jgi:DNA invertase Pin-like site-specific DNA recombinase/RNA polymerase-binding transcription factor DksA
MKQGALNMMADERKFMIGRRAVGYIRVSDERQNLKYGPKSQLYDIQRYCKERQYELVNVVYDIAPGSIWRERSGLAKLREMARREEFDIVVVGRLDRLAREDEIQTVIMEDLAYYHVRTESATEKIEDSPAGRFMLHIYGLMAAEDRRRILERTDAGRRARAREGKLLGGGEPRYGYKWNNDRTAYLINDDVIKVDKNGFHWSEAEVVRFAFRMARQGWPIARIRFHLQNLGIPTRHGKTIWQDSIISKILDCEYYVGDAKVYQRRFETRHNGNGKRSRTSTKRPEEEQIKLPEGVVPALIDRATFEEVQQQKERNRQLAKRSNEKPEDALLRGGLVYCGYCGHAMVVTHHDAKRAHGTVRRAEYACNVALKRYGKCQGVNIATHIVDNEAWQFVLKYIRNPELVNQVLGAQKRQDSSELDLLPIDRSLAEIEHRVKGYQSALERAIEIGAEEEVIGEFLEKIDQYLKRKHALECEKRNIIIDLEKEVEKEEARENFRQWCAEVRQKLDDPHYTPTYEEKRRACEILGIKAKVYRADHKPRIELTALPTELRT